MAIETVEFDLSMADVDTGAYLTGRTYSLTVTDADGVTSTTLENLSIGQLVMALCLERAVAKEKDIIETMNSLNTTSSQLQALTEIESKIVQADGKKGQSVDLTNETVVYNDQSRTYYTFLTSVIGLPVNSSTVSSEDNDLITEIERSMDQRNSMNQQTMIELQSATSKRDQAYDMVANILKSINQVLVGIANNV